MEAGEICHVNSASFRVQRCNGKGSFSEFFRFVKPLAFRGKGVGKEALKTGSNIITDILNEEPKGTVCDIFKNLFIEANGNLEEKLIRLRSVLGLKRKRKPKELSQCKRRKVKDIFTENKKN